MKSMYKSKSIFLKKDNYRDPLLEFPPSSRITKLYKMISYNDMNIKYLLFHEFIYYQSNDTSHHCHFAAGSGGDQCHHFPSHNTQQRPS